ncbi:restriction endonuclease subunit S [Streptococcus pneumoniae]|uniref:restriction endonuclease subunit S n=1 Tax=Streptococcus pneumoniae TaxID=1313 RepID=UPI00061C9FC3|nr:restriction endonuclease subunit S [Streptococcus pneumoniae]CON43143.1 type I restriction-modification system [Streptococcus pneumoniae]
MKKVKLGQLVSIQTGKLDANAAIFGGKYPFFTTAKEISRINEYAYDGEVVLVAGNGDLNVKYYKGKFNAYQRTYILTSNSNVRMKYLYYFLDKYIEVLRYQSIGGVIKYIKLNNLSDAQIPMRSILEQDKIIGILEKLDNEIIIRSKQLSELSNLVKSRFNEMFILSDFSLKRLGELVDEVRYGTSLPATLNGKYGYLRMNNITEDGRLNIQNLKHIDVPEKDLEKYVVRKGDVLFNRTNSIELVGKTCIYELDFDMVIAGYIIRIRTKNNILNPRYLSEFLNFPSTKKFLRNIAKGAVNQANINAKELQDISIPLPPLSLQNEFADFVAQVDKSQFACEIAIKVWRNSLKFSII